MKAEVKWISDELFLATSESGHSLVLDANAGSLAPSPLENVLLSLGACSSVDVVSILKKARLQISTYILLLRVLKLVRNMLNELLIYLQINIAQSRLC